MYLYDQLLGFKTSERHFAEHLLASEQITKLLGSKRLTYSIRNYMKTSSKKRSSIDVHTSNHCQ